MIAFLLPMALPVAQAADAATSAGSSASANCGTNWTSTRKPPQTIRVLLADQGNRVVVVPFRTYVPMVMASGEFPTWLPQAVLQVGATAVKQYGWYYAMKGHHRSNYRTASGVCYDVRNDTMDQLFHTVAHPTPKQMKAIDATWGLTLRKGKRFFLTGYRAGIKSKCGADADGWRIFAKSMVDCADNGMNRQQIQLRYYQPRIKFIWRDVPPPAGGDHTAPSLTVPEVVPSADQPNGNHVRVNVDWSATDDTSKVITYHLQERVGAGRWQQVPLPLNTQTSMTVDTQPGESYQFRVKARDLSGNPTGWVAGAGFVPQVVESETAKLQGTWDATRDVGASGHQVLATTQQGARASLTFQASAIGVMASTGPAMGRVRISIDGVVVDTIDLRSTTPADRRVVWSHSWLKQGKHTISIRALGTAGRPTVDLDAFVLLR